MRRWRLIRQFLNLPKRLSAGRRLVILPVVLICFGVYAAAAALYILSADSGLWKTQVEWMSVVIKLTLSAGGPAALYLVWRHSRLPGHVIPVYDWLGGGLVAYSVVWLGGTLDEVVRREALSSLGLWLLPYSWGLWGLAGTILMIVGTACLSNELYSERLERDRLEALTAFTRHITSLDYQSVMDGAVDHLYRLLGADACVLFLWNEAEQVLVPVAGIHDPAIYNEAYVARMMSFKCPKGFGLTGWAMEHGQGYICGDVAGDPRSQVVPGYKVPDRSCLLATLAVEGRLLGVVRLTRGGLHQFTPEDLELAQSFASQAALVIEHGRIVKELSELSITDHLTALYNARHFHQVLTMEISRSQRQGLPLALVMIDSDSLKQVNDRSGHQQGDEYIRAIGQVLRKHIRLCDYAFRYAGDEFMLLLPGTGEAGAFTVAERVRHMVEALNVADATISAGVAVYPLHAGDAEGLIAAANRAMYQSKRAGKNRVTTASAVQPVL